ncbi:hypothetical protein GQ602_002782 [Ophiocordyceps camponoti-floridani]|uniref:Subtilisin-like serine protease n=1 Tax=Ophiocordyceps camponoti-floridani TaxID=2030778 RepID=A0A8H4VFW4_9HYPO|nr:hypothetical protein GQ602_002782 [Ophiocordyceps camponoti-floridani]
MSPPLPRWQADSGASNSRPFYAEPPFNRDVAPVVNGRFRYDSSDCSEGSMTSGASQFCSPPLDAINFSSYKDLTPTLYLAGGQKGARAYRIDSIEEYLAASFDLERLHLIQNRLWLAGLPVPARSLHRQKILGREIVITDQSDLHLTWRESTLFLKPLWEPLLDHGFWRYELCNKDVKTYLSATGLLMSYIWLICSEPDLLIAKQHNLVPRKLNWAAWAFFSRDFLDRHSLDGHNEDMAKRYDYGELRIQRLNLIYRFAPETFPNYLLRGYLYGYNQFSQFFGRNFAWAAVAVLYAGVVLAAMQVALAVPPIKDDVSFQRAAYGFTVFILVAMVFFSTFALAYLVIVFNLNLIFTRQKVRQHEQRAKEATRSNNAP